MGLAVSRFDDNDPSGSPDNSYWRRRRTEATWQLREALLDGNVKVAARLLGIDAAPSSAQQDSVVARCCGLIPASETAQPPGKRMPDDYIYHPPPQPGSRMCDDRRSKLIIGCAALCYTLCCWPVVCFYVIREWLQPNDIETEPASSTTRTIVPSEAEADSCRSLNLDTHRWEDDCGMSALHYLALGRRETLYWKMRFNVPPVGPTGIQWLEGAKSIEQRRDLLRLLLRHGRLAPHSVTAVNSHGATALHAAACVGDCSLIEAMIRKTDKSGRHTTFADGAVDTALSTPDNLGSAITGATPVDVAASFGHPAAARLLGLGLLSNIEHVRSIFLPILISESGGGVNPGGGRSTGVAREDSDIVPSSWALESEGSSGAAAAVKVLKDDEARLEHLRLKQRQLAAQLGMPLSQASALLAQHSFDLELALDAHQRSMDTYRKMQGAPDEEEEDEEDHMIREETLEIMHTTHDEVRLQVHDGEVAGGHEECPVCFETVPRAEVVKSMCLRALKECRHFVCDRCLFASVHERVMDKGDLVLPCPKT